MNKSRIILVIAFFLYSISNAQCPPGPSGAGPFDANTLTVGNRTLLTNGIWAGDYVRITNMTVGNTYRFDNCGASYDSETTLFDTSLTAVAWDNGSCSSSDDGEILHTITTPGDYRFQTNLEGCGSQTFTNTSMYITLTSILGITDNEFERNIIHFTNPVSEKVNIRLQKKYMKIKVEVSNILGKVITTNNYIETDNISFNINGLTGLYFLKISNEKGESTVLKIVKK